MSLIQELKELQADRLSLDEKIELSARAKALAGEYTAYGLPVPGVITEGQRSLAVEIKAQARDVLLKELREVENSKTQLMTADQKREMLATRESELQARLAALGG